MLGNWFISLFYSFSIQSTCLFLERCANSSVLNSPNFFFCLSYLIEQHDLISLFLQGVCFLFSFPVELEVLRELWLIRAEMIEWEEKRRKCVDFSPKGCDNNSSHRMYEMILWGDICFSKITSTDTFALLCLLGVHRMYWKASATWSR